MEFILTPNEYSPEVLEIINAFFPVDNDNLKIQMVYEVIKNTVKSKIVIQNEEQKKEYNLEKDLQSSNVKKTLKFLMYQALSNFTNKKLPWGCLTGIRPTKLAYDLLKSGVKKANLISTLQNEYCVSTEKANLVLEIIQNQNQAEQNDNLVDLYINIPFCTTRCSYCSFISAEISKIQDLVEPYVDTLIYEIEQTKKLIQEKNYIVKSIYMGGGTPTSLSAEQLDKILSVIGYDVKEFTVEAGRPDTITKEKLDVLAKHKVTRISVNPQSFNDKVLKSIGRNHTAIETINAYRLARNYPFQINMDLIAGLTSETLASFKNNIDICCELSPNDITVHTLTLKRASIFAIKNENIFKKSPIEKMLKYAYDKLPKCGYKPYYLYRQKNMVGNLENVGFYSGNSKCVFNIDSMEEIATIIGCGANAITKRVYSLENRIERQANVKDIKEYIGRIDEMLNKKRKLFDL